MGVCFCGCKCVGSVVLLNYNSKFNHSNNMKLKYILVYANGPDKFDIGQVLISLYVLLIITYTFFFNIVMLEQF